MAKRNGEEEMLKQVMSPWTCFRVYWLEGTHFPLTPIFFLLSPWIYFRVYSLWKQKRDSETRPGRKQPGKILQNDKEKIKARKGMRNGIKRKRAEWHYLIIYPTFIIHNSTSYIQHPKSYIRDSEIRLSTHSCHPALFLGRFRPSLVSGSSIWGG